MTRISRGHKIIFKLIYRIINVDLQNIYEIMLRKRILTPFDLVNEKCVVLSLYIYFLIYQLF